MVWDLLLFEYVNSFVGHSQIIDQMFDHLTVNYLFKGAVPILCFWYLWFRGSEEGDALYYVRLSSVLLVALVGSLVGRVLALMLPFKNRPFVEDGVMTNLPLGNFQPELSKWSSFPSDHAVLFFALAVAIFFVHRLLGVMLVLHAALVICFPRVFIGLHWPFDVIAGAIIGVLVALVVMPFGVKLMQWLFAKFEWLGDRMRAVVMSLTVLLTAEIATLFSATRFFLQAVAKALKLAIG